VSYKEIGSKFNAKKKWAFSKMIIVVWALENTLLTMKIGKKTFFIYAMVSASFCNSRVSWVCKSLNFFFKDATPIMTMFSGFSDPHDSTVKKNLFGLLV